MREVTPIVDMMTGACADLSLSHPLAPKTAPCGLFGDVSKAGDLPPFSPHTGRRRGAGKEDLRRAQLHEKTNKEGTAQGPSKTTRWRRLRPVQVISRRISPSPVLLDSREPLARLTRERFERCRRSQAGREFRSPLGSREFRQPSAGVYPALQSHGGPQLR